MTEFKCGTWCPGILEVMWGWWKWVLESGMDCKLISMSLWALWDVTEIQETERATGHMENPQASKHAKGELKPSLSRNQWISFVQTHQIVKF